MGKFSKKYKEMIKRHSKKIKEDAKSAAEDPFDWEPGLQVFVDHLYFMRDYYSLGENVWAKEDCTWRDDVKYTRLQMLNQILDEYEGWMNCEHKYFIHHDTGGKENGRGLIINGEPTDWWIEYLIPDYKENVEAFHKEYDEHKSKFFTLLAEYIEFLWD